MSALISIEPSHEAKVLADWYSLLGFETKEFKGGYYAELDTASGHSILRHPSKKGRCPGEIVRKRLDCVPRRKPRERALSSLKTKGLAALSY